MVPFGTGFCRIRIFLLCRKMLPVFKCYITYIVLVQTLNHAQSINQSSNASVAQIIVIVSDMQLFRLSTSYRNDMVQVSWDVRYCSSLHGAQSDDVGAKLVQFSEGRADRILLACVALLVQSICLNTVRQHDWIIIVVSLDCSVSL